MGCVEMRSLRHWNIQIEMLGKQNKVSDERFGFVNNNMTDGIISILLTSPLL